MQLALSSPLAGNILPSSNNIPVLLKLHQNFYI